MPEITKALEVNDLTVSYDRKVVLWNVSHTVPTGLICGIMGPNGAGKSTFLKAVMGLVKPVTGSARILGKDASEVRNLISYVPQRESVDWDFPATVKEVVMMGRYGRLGLFRSPGKVDKEIVAQSLEQVGLGALANRHISQLSGGQQQRVFLARALARQADIYFMDEPFAGVDIATEEAIIDLLRKLRNEGKTIFVVHHDLQTAGDYFDHLILLNLHLVAAGDKASVLTQENLQKAFGGRLNVLAKVTQDIRNRELPLTEE